QTDPAPVGLGDTGREDDEPIMTKSLLRQSDLE
ncbi:MAG: hypothetical protein JWR11_2868, partial [Mycobacterium sp.]|nr:hypothetical protein [Mycobacterium sp.]